MPALCVCEHTRDEHTGSADRCGVIVRDVEYGLYQCTCPRFEQES